MCCVNDPHDIVGIGCVEVGKYGRYLGNVPNKAPSRALVNFKKRGWRIEEISEFILVKHQGYVGGTEWNRGVGVSG